MIVSISQLKKFLVQKPVHSRASENSEFGRAMARIEGITAGDANRAASNSETAAKANAGSSCEENRRESKSRQDCGACQSSS